MDKSLFLFEFAKSTAEKFEESIAIEGYAMFKAMLIAFRGIDFKILSFEKEKNYIKKFEALANLADFSLCIAPESDDLLYKLTKSVEKSSSQNLGSSSRAIKAAGDKLRLAEILKELSPETFAYEKISNLDFPFIAKPRKGTGGERVVLIKNEDELHSFIKNEKALENYIFQEYVKGTPCSASLVLNKHDRSAKLLSAQLQLLDNFSYRGSALPLKISEKIKEAIIEACNKINGLHGYAGVDFVIEESTGEARIIEINPRITTSAVAIAHAVGFKTFAEVLLKNHLSESLSIPEIKRKIKIEKRKKEKGKRKKERSMVFAETGNFEIALLPW